MTKKIKSLKQNIFERVFKHYLTTTIGIAIIITSLGLVIVNKIQPIDLTYILPLAVVLFGLKDNSNDSDSKETCNK